MNRKEFQIWLNNFPEDTEIVVVACDYWSGDKPNEVEFKVSESEKIEIQHLKNGDWPYLYLIGNTFKYYHDNFIKTLTLGNNDA